jgi:hypothetical protein
MIIILPLFFETKTEEKLFLEKWRGERLPFAGPSPMQPPPGSRLFVVTPSLEVARMLAETGVEVVRAEGIPPDSVHGLPPGARGALRALLRQNKIAPDDVVAVADWLRLTPDMPTLARAWRESSAEDGVFLASLREIRDHPVQCHVPYLLLGLDMLIFPEDRERSACLLSGLALDRQRYRLSKPFFLDWREYEVWSEEPRLYALDFFPNSSCPRLRPAQAENPGSQPLFFWDGPFRARRVAEAASGKLEPAYLSRASVRGRLDHGDGPKRTVSFDIGGLPRDASVRLWPFTETLLGTGMEFPVKDGVSGVLRCPLPEPADGVIAAVVAAASGAEYDFAEALIGGETLWTVDPVTKLRLDPVTGRPFANRQEFPRLFTMAGEVAAGQAAILLDNAGITAPKPFILSTAQSPSPFPESSFPVSRAISGACPPFGSSPASASRPPDPARAEWKEIFEALGAMGDNDADATLFSWTRALRNIDRKVAKASFKFRHIGEFVLFHTPPAARSLSLDTAAAYCMDKIEGLRRELRELLQWPAILPSLPACVRLCTPPETPILSQMPLPGPQPPLTPRVLTSDGKSRLYASCYDANWNASLYLKDMESGELRPLGKNGTLYSGVWFDPAQDMLYATLYFLDKRPFAAIDVLDGQGRLLERQPLTARSGAQMFTPCALSGDGQNIFFLDAPCHSIIVLDKTSLDIRDIVQVQDSEYITDVKAANGVLNMSVMHKSIVQRTNLQGDSLERLADPSIALPRIIAPHPVRRLLYVLHVDHIPVTSERLHQSLTIHRGYLAPAPRLDLGIGRTNDMHLLRSSGDLVIADFYDGLQLLRINLAAYDALEAHASKTWMRS